MATRYRKRGKRSGKRRTGKRRTLRRGGGHGASDLIRDGAGGFGPVLSKLGDKFGIAVP